MEINTKIQEFSNKFKQLKQCEFPIIKRTIIAQLRKLAAEAEGMMQLKQCAQNSKRRRQISDILKRCAQVEQQMEVRPERESIYTGRNAVNANLNSCQEDLTVSKRAVRSVIMHTIRSSELRIKPEEIEEIARKMENNLEVMKQIEGMVREQGNDLQRIDEYLEHAEENVNEANLELDQAIQIQHRTRMLKLRLAVTGFFGGLGYKILGLPGMLFGMVFGFKSSS